MQGGRLMSRIFGFDTLLERIPSFAKGVQPVYFYNTPCSPFWHMGIKIGEEKADGINSKIISGKESVV